MNHDHDPFSPAEREQLAQELLELHFGCHEDPATLETRLAAEPALRELQREVLQQAKVLERAVRPDQAPLRLATGPRAAGAARGWHRLRSPVFRLGAAAAAAAVLVGGLFVAERFAHFRHVDFDRKHVHLTVSAPKAVPAGAPWTFTVETKDLRGTAMDCKVTWESFAQNGAKLATGEVGTRSGAATVAMRADLNVPARVLVTARSADDTATQTLPLSTAAAGPLVHLTTDRPVYRPGEPLFVRAVVLDRVTRLPMSKPQPMVVQLLDAQDAPIGNDLERTAVGGVGSFKLQIPADSAGGALKVVVRSPAGDFPPETTEVVVRSFQPPQLQKTVVLDRTSYAPGARGSATVTVLRIAAGGGAASGATAKASLVLDGNEVWSGKQALGGNGDATFAFTVPKDVLKGAARFVATIDDGGIVETEVKPFVVPTGKVAIAAFPEGGELVAGVENGVYLECTDPLGRPVDGTGDVLDGRGRVVATVRTAHQGRGKFAFVPRAGESYTVRLAGRSDTFPLPTVRERGIAMVLRGDDIAAGGALRMALAGRGDGPWLVGVFCRGVLVGQTTVRAGDDGELRTTVEVPLPSYASGVLRATVFDRTLQPIAERLLRRHSTERLEVALAVDTAAPSPGATQKVNVRTTDEAGRPAPAIVGLSVTDQAAVSLGSEPQPGIVDHAMLFADVERTENLGDFFLAHAGSAQHVDLLLGTRGWRRFVWRNDGAAQAAIAARGPAAEGILAREGFSHTPQVASNLAAARAPGQELQRFAWKAERWLADAFAFACMALVLLLLCECVAWVLRRGFGVEPAMQGIGAVVAVALLLSLVYPNTIGSAVLVDAMAPGAEAWDFSERRDAEPVPIRTPAMSELYVRDFDTELAEWELGAGATRNYGVTANSLASAFFNDGGEVDIRARTENFFTTDLARVFLPPRIRDIPASSSGLAEKIVEGEAGFFIQHYRVTPRDQFQAWQQRQYAHRHTPSDDRTDFTLTVLWNTLIVTDERGEASTSFATSDAVTTWRVHADAHASSGTGRLGQATFAFSTRLPLHIEAKLPDEVSAGDRLQLPVNVVATDPALTEVALTVRVGNGLQLAAEVPTRVALSNGRGRALLPITVADHTGSTTLGLEVRAGHFVDRLQHRLSIAPRGFPHRRTVGGQSEAGMPSTARIAVPSAPVPGTGRVTLTAYPSPIAALTQGLEGILQEPHGCFEQASSSNYPNTLVLNLLEANGDDVPVVAARARALLPAGYRKITGYECSQKGYEWFGKNPGHEALTAYGLLQFADMAKVHDVDATMVDRTRAWLMARRDGKGNYPHGGTGHHSWGGGQPTTNAYVTYALLQSGTPAAELKVELDALIARVSTEDAYELALIACALHLAKRPEAAAARTRLRDRQEADGALRGKTSITNSGGNDLAVEATGFAILAWLPDPAFTGNVRNAVEFVQKSRSGSGTFGATQATIAALRALTAYAAEHRATRTPGTIRVFEGDKQLAERAFAANENGVLTFELWSQLAAGEHELRVEVEGGGTPLAWACEVAYHAEQPADDPAAPLALTTSLRKATAEEGDTVALDVVVRNTTTATVPTPIAIVGLPAGCELQTRVLEDLQRAEAFAFWELRGRELVLYWRELAPGAEQKLTLDLVARVPGATTGPASRAYPYYAPAQKRWDAPLAVNVKSR